MEGNKDAFLEECPFCKAKLKSLGITLSDTFIDDMQYADDLISNANTALNADLINRLNLKDEDVYFYFKAAFEQIAKGKFLKWTLENDIKKNNNLDKDTHIFIFNGEVYLHE